MAASGCPKCAAGFLDYGHPWLVAWVSMPKILRTVSGFTLEGNDAPAWFDELDLSPDRIPGRAEYYSLGDDGVVYVIDRTGGDADPAWWALRWLPAKSVEKRENIFHMCSKGVMAGDISPSFPTKKQLQEAIENGELTFSPWDQTPIFITQWEERCDYHRNKAKKKEAEKVPTASKIAYGSKPVGVTANIDIRLQTPDPVAISEGIQLHKTKNLVIGARVWFGFCMFCFVCVLAAGGVSKTWALGLGATAPGLLGFANLKTLEQQARDRGGRNPKKML